MSNLIQLPINNSSKIYKGDTWKGIELEILKNAVAINLTGATIKLNLFPKNTNNTALILVTGNGISLTDPVNGKFKIDQISRLNYEPGVYTGDVEITLSNNEKTTYCSIALTISPDITA